MSEATNSHPMIYRKMARVMAALAKAGIGKNEKNKQQGFSYRSIDSVYNVAAPILAAEGIILMPRITEKKVSRFEIQKSSQNGAYVQNNFHCTLTADVYFYAEDGSSTHATVVAGSIDQGDKAELQAQSQLVKYAIIHAFQIPVVGQDIGDGDGNSVDLKGAATQAQNQVQHTNQAQGSAQDQVQQTNQAAQHQEPAPQPQPALIDSFDHAKDQLDTCTTIKQLADSWALITPAVKAQLNGYKEHLKGTIQPQRKASLNDQFSHPQAH